MTFLETHPDGTLMRVRVVPRAAREEVGEILGDALKIRLTAPPVEGKANRALLKFIARTLGVPGSRITLLSGKTGRTKRLLIQGVSRAWMADKLGFPGDGT